MANDNKDIKRGIVLYLDGKEIKNSAVAIQAEMRKVKKEIDSCTIGSEEYVAATKKYQELNAILADHKARLKGINQQLGDNAAKSKEAQSASRNWLKWGIDKFNAYSVAILGVVAALTGVTMKLMAFKKLGNDKEESAANLKALTGLDDNSIEWLTKEAERLSTTMDDTGLRVRKSSKEILDAYMLVGSAKPELLKDREALNAVTIEAMRLAEAAKMNLKDAVDGVTLALNQYGAGADQAARYVNVLAAGSKEGAAGVEAQTASIIKAGVAASVAGVPIEQLVGSIENLAEKGIKGEIAGTGLKTFFLKLEGGAKDCRPSVVGLQTALENLQKKQLSVTEMQKMFGLEAYTVAQAMISGADSVKKYTEAVTDTSVATEQAAINSNTNAAKMAQLKNKMNETGIVLAQRLTPAFSLFTNWTGKFIQSMPALLDFLRDYGIYLAELSVAYIALTTRVTAAERATAAYDAVVNFRIGIQKAYAAMVSAVKLAAAGNAAAHVTLTRTIISCNTVQRAAIAVSALYRSAMLALKGQTMAAAVSFKAFRTAIALINPWTKVALAITAVTLAVTALVKAQNNSVNQHRALNELDKKAAERYDEQASKIELLTRIVHDNNTALGKRREALDELKGIVKDYKADLTDEGKLINDNTDAIKKYMVEFEKQTRLKAAQEDLEAKIREKRQAEREVKKLEASAKQAAAGVQAAQNNTTATGQYSGQGGAALLHVARLAQVKSAYDELKQINNDIEDLFKEIETTKISSSAIITQNGDSDGDGDGGDGTDPVDRSKRVKAELENIEIEANHKLNELKKQFIDGQIKDEDEYSRMAESIELERLSKSMQVAGLEPDEREKMMSKVQDIYLDAKKKLMEFYADDDDNEKASYQSRLNELDKAKDKEKSVIDHAHALNIISEEKYNKALLSLDEKYNKRREAEYKRSEEYKMLLKRLAETEFNSDAYVQNLGENEGNNLNVMDYFKKLKTEIDNAKEQLLNMDPDSDEYKVVEDYMDGLIQVYNEKGKMLTDVMQEIGASIGESLGNAIAGEEVSLKSALKSLLLIVIDAIEQMITATMVVPTLQALTGLGAAKAWASLAKLIAVKAAFSVIKSAARGWESGGYTGTGRHDEPAGIVHRGEFVANRFALSNPAVKAVLDIVDKAQRNGSVQNLTKDDLNAVTIPASAPSVRYLETFNQVAANASQDNGELIDLLKLLKERFDKPIVAETYATGKGGTMEAEKLANKMINNASRR